MTPAKFRELALAATPGPYSVWDGNPWHADAPKPSKAFPNGTQEVFACRGGSNFEQQKRDTAFLAACDPQTILALLAVAETAEQMREGYRLDGQTGTLPFDVALAKLQTLLKA